MKTLYDSKCEELARYFLADHPYQDEDAQNLAGDIQQAVEDWFTVFQENNAK
jgi:hypothetical protein